MRYIKDNFRFLTIFGFFKGGSTRTKNGILIALTKLEKEYILLSQLKSVTK